MLTITRLGLWGLLLTLTPLAYAQDTSSEEAPDLVGEEETTAAEEPEATEEAELVEEAEATEEAELAEESEVTEEAELVEESTEVLTEHLEEPAPPIPAIVTLTDGQVLRGDARDNGSGGLVLKLPGGAVMDLAADAVESVRYLDQTSGDSRFAYPNPAATRYFFAPTAIPLEQGSLYLAQKMIMFTEVAYTPTENITIMAASSIPMFFVALTEGEFDILGGLFGAKVSAPAGDGVWAGGGVWGAAFDGTVFALPFGNITFGTPDKNLTIGAGFTYVSDPEVNENLIPVVIAGSTRISDKVALMTENWVFTSTAAPDKPLAVLSGGVRFINRQLTADLALMAMAFEGEFLAFPLPWIDLGWRFR